MSRLLVLACAFAGISATTEVQEVQAAPLAPHLPIVVSIHSHLEAIADRVNVQAPDVRVLTTEPVAPEHMKGASSGFGWRDDPIRHVRKFHGGDDYRGDRGRPIRAAGNGTVILAQRQGGYGNVIYVDHGGGLITRYGHLSRIGVKKGEAVVAGQTIGKLGSTGRTTGPHLHFEVRIDGSPVDPSKAMSIAELQREDPIAGRIAAFALSPELQSKSESRFDPPKRSKSKKSEESRPDRPSRVRTPRPVS